MSHSLIEVIIEVYVKEIFSTSELNQMSVDLQSRQTNQWKKTQVNFPFQVLEFDGNSIISLQISGAITTKPQHSIRIENLPCFSC